MKKNLKKLVALGLVATTGATLSAGCGGSDKGGSKDGKVELVMSVWDSDQEPVMKQMAEAYSKENPNVTVKTQLTTWNEYWTKLEASATGGSAPDIITMNVLHVEEYADAGILMDLTDAEKESDLKVHDSTTKKSLIRQELLIQQMTGHLKISEKLVKTYKQQDFRMEFIRQQLTVTPDRLHMMQLYSQTVDIS